MCHHVMVGRFGHTQEYLHFLRPTPSPLALLDPARQGTHTGEESTVGKKNLNKHAKIHTQWARQVHAMAGPGWARPSPSCSACKARTQTCDPPQPPGGRGAPSRPGWARLGQAGPGQARATAHPCCAGGCRCGSPLQPAGPCLARTLSRTQRCRAGPSRCPQTAPGATRCPPCSPEPRA